MNKFKLIFDFYKKDLVIDYEKLKFFGVSNKLDVYNPSRIFEFNGKEYVFGRVEKRKDWANSKVMLFRKKDFRWKRVRLFRSFKLEDPFITKIYNEFVFGGVFVKKSSGKIEFKTVFYKGKNFFSLKKFAEGPWGMKDIRLVGLEDGKVGVFTRPLGGKYGKGKIGFIVLDSLYDLSSETINKAKLVRFPFGKEEWGGINDVLLIKKDILGVIGHLAYSDKDEKKFYYPISFKFNLKEKKISELKLLFKRDNLPFELPKNRFLYNVTFPGGIFLDKGKARLSIGVGDSKAYEVLIKNPFK